MINLVKFELYKIISKRSLLIGLLFFILIYGFGTFYDYETQKEYKNIAEKEFNRFEGKLTEEKLKLAQEGHKKIEKKAMEGSRNGKSFLEVLSTRDRALDGVYEHVSMIAGIQKRKEERINELYNSIENNVLNDYKHKQSKLEYNMLKDISKPEIYDESFWGGILGYFDGVGFLALGAISLLGLSSVFTEEYSTRMDRLILSSKNGKSKVITSKIISAFIFIVCMCIIVFIVNFITILILYGNNVWDIPIQSFSPIAYSPYDFTTIEFLLIQILFNFVGILSFSLLVLALSSISKSLLIPFFIGGMVYILPVLIKIYLPYPKGYSSYGSKHWIETLENLSYVGVSKAYDLFNGFYTLNIFERPILYPYAAIVIMIILGILSTIFIYISFRRHQVKS